MKIIQVLVLSVKVFGDISCTVGWKPMERLHWRSQFSLVIHIISLALDSKLFLLNLQLRPSISTSENGLFQFQFN